MRAALLSQGLAVMPTKRPSRPVNRLYNSCPIQAADFIKEEWSDYAQNSLLYTEHIQRIDPPLNKAIYYQAKLLGKKGAEYALELGILSRHHVLNPPKGPERQAKLLQQVRLRELAQRLISQAATFAAEVDKDKK